MSTSGVWHAQADDLANSLLESHVQHPVGFVEDQVFELGQTDFAAFDEIDESARSRDENVATTLDGRHLKGRGDAAVRHATIHLEGVERGRDEECGMWEFYYIFAEATSPLDPKNMGLN